MAEKIYQNVLIVRAESLLKRRVLGILARRGIRGTVAGQWSDARREIDARQWDLVLADASGDEEAALPFVRDVKAALPELPVVVLGDQAIANRVDRHSPGADQVGDPCDL